MIELLIIIVLLVLIVLNTIGNNKGLVMITVENFEFWVRDLPDKNEAGKVLLDLKNSLIELLKYIESNTNIIDEDKRFLQYIPQMKEKLKYVKIKETPADSKQTSYSVNKGESLVFCIRSKKDNSLHSINDLLYVAIHELAHIGCPEIGHTKLFLDLNLFLLKQAINFNIYKFENYDTNPIEYCGITLNHTILN